jgi:hypothetical protein
MKFLPTVVIGLILLIPLLALLGMEMTAKEIITFVISCLVGTFVIWLFADGIDKFRSTDQNKKQKIEYGDSYSPKWRNKIVSSLEEKSEKIGRRLKNIFCFPFRLLWNLFVTFLIIKAFIIWYGFIFGSVVGVILIYIFVPHLFGLPLWLVHWYTGFWKDESDDELWD